MENILQLLICLGALIWVVWLFLGYGAKHKGTVDSKVHTLYLSGIGTLIIMELVVYICLSGDTIGKRDIMDTITFGATLSSLILSVVAIFFTLSSGRDNDKTLGSIENAIKRLEETSGSLSEFKIIAKEISDKTEDLRSHVDEHHKEQMERLRSLGKDSRSFNGDSSESNDNIEKSDLEKVYPLFVLQSSYYGLLGLIGCVYAFERAEKDGAKTGNLSLSIFKQIISAQSIEVYIRGYVVAATCIDFLEAFARETDIVVKSISESAKELCMKTFYLRLKKTKDSGETEDFDKMLNALNTIRQHFSFESLSFDELESIWGNN